MRAGPSLWEILLEAIVILLIPVTVVTFFFVAWWSAFIPLGLLIAGGIAAILFRLHRLSAKVRQAEETMDI